MSAEHQHQHLWITADAGQAVVCGDCGNVKSCQHANFHFENGGLHLVCDRCGCVYANVGHCPARFIQNIQARALPLTSQDRRVHPQLQSLTPTRSKK